MGTAFPLVWYWRNGAPRQRSALERKGQRCRALCRGRNGNVLFEFPDGFQTVAPRRAARRA